MLLQHVAGYKNIANNTCTLKIRNCLTSLTQNENLRKQMLSQHVAGNKKMLLTFFKEILYEKHFSFLKNYKNISS